MKCLETKDIAVRRMFEIGDICIINKGIEVGGILTGTYRFFDILYGFNDTTTLFVFIHE